MALNPGGLPSATNDLPAMDARPTLRARMQRGGMWFIVIAALSGFNAFMQLSNAKLHFIFGLGITDIVNQYARNHGQSGVLPMVLVDGLIMLLLVLCGVWARNGSQAAFMSGMIAYAVDGGVLLVYGGWIEGLVHAYALWRVWDGYAACSELSKLNQAAQPGLAQVKLP
jgi:hypothetical protein